MTKDPKKILDYLITEHETLELEFEPRSIQRARDLCGKAGLPDEETKHVILAFVSEVLKLEDKGTIALMKMYHTTMAALECKHSREYTEYYTAIVAAIEEEAKGR